MNKSIDYLFIWLPAKASLCPTTKIKQKVKYSDTNLFKCISKKGMQRLQFEMEPDTAIASSAPLHMKRISV